MAGSIWQAGRAVRDAEDFVADLLAVVQTVCTPADPAVLVQLEQQVRARWGGGEVYIPKKRPIHERKAAALQDWRNGAPIAQASAAHGIDRCTLYRLINRRSGG